MNKFIKYTAIITVVSLIITLLTWQKADFSQLKKINLNFSHTEVNPEDLVDFNMDRRFTFSDASAVQIKMISGNVRVLPSSTEDIRVKVKGKIDRKYLDQADSKIVVQDGNEVVINLGEIIQDVENIGGSISLDEIKLNFIGELESEIHIPKKFNTVNLASVSGETRLEKLKLSQLAIQTVSGDCKIKDSSVEKLKVVAVSSDIELENFSFKDARVETVSGDIAFTPAPGFKFSSALDTISGEIEGKLIQSGEDNKISIKTVSGDFEIKQ